MSELLGWALRIADLGCLLWVGLLLGKQTQALIAFAAGRLPVDEANRRVVGLLPWMGLFAVSMIVFRAASGRLLQGS